MDEKLDQIEKNDTNWFQDQRIRMWLAQNGVSGINWMKIGQVVLMSDEAPME